MACLLDISGDGVWDKLVNNILKVCGADFPLDDVDHLLSDVPDLLGLGIAGLLGGHILLAGEPNTEEAEHFSFRGSWSGSSCPKTYYSLAPSLTAKVIELSLT